MVDTKAEQKIEVIPMDKVRENDWNPNVMTDAEFDRLAEEIEEVGFIDPIQVVPMDDGTYQIIGGEHRYRALKVLGYEDLQCVILDDEKWKDEDLKKFVTMRLNVIRGKIDSKKFMNLYNDLSKKHKDEALKTMMGFTSDDTWKAVTKEAKKALKKTGAPKEVVKQFEDVTKEIKSIDNLSEILHKIFKKYGNTLQYNFMWFTFGDKEHLYVKCGKELWNIVKGLMDKVHQEEADANKVFTALLSDWQEIIDFGKGSEEKAEVEKVEEVNDGKTEKDKGEGEGGGEEGKN